MAQPVKGAPAFAAIRTITTSAVAQCLNSRRVTSAGVSGCFTRSPIVLMVAGHLGASFLIARGTYTVRLQSEVRVAMEDAAQCSNCLRAPAATGTRPFSTILRANRTTGLIPGPRLFSTDQGTSMGQPNWAAPVPAAQCLRSLRGPGNRDL